MEHSAITNAVPDSRVGRIQDGLHFWGCQVSDQTALRFLCRNGQNPLNLFQSRRYPVLHVTPKGFDGREPDVSGGGAIATRSFQMAQEVHDQRSIEVFQLELRWRNLEAIAGVLQQQPESIGIGVASVRAGASLNGQTLQKKSRDVRRKRSHGCPPVKKSWQESAIFLNRSGVASKSQDVSSTLL